MRGRPRKKSTSSIDLPPISAPMARGTAVAGGVESSKENENMWARLSVLTAVTSLLVACSPVDEPQSLADPAADDGADDAEDTGEAASPLCFIWNVVGPDVSAPLTAT